MALLDSLSQFIVAMVALGGFGLTVYNTFMIKEVKHATNSIMSDRLAEAKIASEAEGELQGRALQRAEHENGK